MLHLTFIMVVTARTPRKDVRDSHMYMPGDPQGNVTFYQQTLTAGSDNLWREIEYEAKIFFFLSAARHIYLLEKWAQI